MAPPSGRVAVSCSAAACKAHTCTSLTHVHTRELFSPLQAWSPNSNNRERPPQGPRSAISPAYSPLCGLHPWASVTALPQSEVGKDSRWQPPSEGGLNGLVTVVTEMKRSRRGGHWCTALGGHSTGHGPGVRSWKRLGGGRCVPRRSRSSKRYASRNTGFCSALWLHPPPHPVTQDLPLGPTHRFHHFQ